MAQIPSEIYLVFADARTNNNKFWSAIARNDGTLETTWGRIGYSGQTKTEGCGSYSRAITKLHILATTKKRKGYKESQPPKQLSSQLNIRRALQLLEQIKPSCYYLSQCSSSRTSNTSATATNTTNSQ